MSALDILAGLVLEDGQRWGEVAEPIQVEDARALLTSEPGAPKLHALTRARGRSKTTDLAGASVAALVDLLPPGAQGYGAAADRDQAALLVREAAGFVLRSGLGDVLDVETWRVVNRKTAASVVALPADGPSAYGLRPRWVVVDELGQWASTPRSEAFWEALASSFGKVADCVVAVITTEPAPGTMGHRILTSAAGSPRWRVHRVPGPPPWMTPEAIEEQQRLLMPSAFRRLILNEPDVADEDRLVGWDDLEACVESDRLVLPPDPGCRYAVALDVGLRRDRTVLVVAHREVDEDGPYVVVDRLHRWVPGGAEAVDLSDVEATVLQAAREYDAGVWVDPWQAALLAQRLRAEGVAVSEFVFSASSVGRLAHGLFTALQNRGLLLPDDPELIDELLNVRLRTNSSGTVRLDHASGGHDDQAVAVALAIHGVAEMERRPPVVSMRIVNVGTA